VAALTALKKGCVVVSGGLSRVGNPLSAGMRHETLEFSTTAMSQFDPKQPLVTGKRVSKPEYLRRPSQDQLVRTATASPRPLATSTYRKIYGIFNFKDSVGACREQRPGRGRCGNKVKARLAALSQDMRRGGKAAPPQRATDQFVAGNSYSYKGRHPRAREATIHICASPSAIQERQPDDCLVVVPTHVKM
jgi:hypothetical protein